MAKTIKIGGRIESTETGNVVAGANAILDDTKGKKQNAINADVDAELLRLENAKQDNLTFDNTPTEGSTNPVTSGGVYTATLTLEQAIEAILLLIPSAASALNKLVDTDLMNSSIATNTATFRGTSASGLTEEQFLAWANTLEHDNNDYVFWQTVDADGNTLFKRYKYVTGTGWVYEYTLNNSSFTAAQWAAIESGITASLVSKINGLPNATELALLFDAKQNVLTFDNAPTSGSSNPVKSSGVYTAIGDEAQARSDADTILDGKISDEATARGNADDALQQAINGVSSSVTGIEGKIPAGASASNKMVDNNSMVAYVASIMESISSAFTITTDDGHVSVTLRQIDGLVSQFTLSTNDIASEQVLQSVASRMSTAEGNISSLSGRISINETDIANLQQLYNNLQQSKPVPITSLPQSGQQQGVIYRLAGSTSYSDYMWNGSTWVIMATYNNAIDDAPTFASENLVKSGGVANAIAKGGGKIELVLGKEIYGGEGTVYVANSANSYVVTFLKINEGEEINVYSWLNNDYNYAISFWSALPSNGTYAESGSIFISGLHAPASKKGKVSLYTATAPAGAAYVALQGAKAQERYGFFSTDNSYTNAVRIGKLEEDVETLDRDVIGKFSGYIESWGDDTDHYVNISGSQSYVGEIIECNEGDVISVLSQLPYNTYGYAISFWNAKPSLSASPQNSIFISGIKATSETGGKLVKYTATAPAGAVYAVVSSGNVANAGYYNLNSRVTILEEEVAAIIDNNVTIEDDLFNEREKQVLSCQDINISMIDLPDDVTEASEGFLYIDTNNNIKIA